MATSDTTSEGSERMAATPASAAVSGGEGAAAKARSLGEISGVHLGGPEPNVTEIGTPGGTGLAAEVAALNKDESVESTSELESSSGSEGDYMTTEYGTPTVSTPTPLWPPYSSKTVNNDSLTWELGESVIETPTRGCRRVTFGEETPASNYKAGGDGRVVGVVRETGVPQAPVYWGDLPAGRDRPYPDEEMGSSMQWPHGRDRPYDEVLMQYAPPLHGRDRPNREPETGKGDGLKCVPYLWSDDTVEEARQHPQSLPGMESRQPLGDQSRQPPGHQERQRMQQLENSRPKTTTYEMEEANQSMSGYGLRPPPPIREAGQPSGVYQAPWEDRQSPGDQERQRMQQWENSRPQMTAYEMEEANQSMSGYGLRQPPPPQRIESGQPC